MEKCSKFPDPQIPPESALDDEELAFQPALPTETEECQAECIPPEEFEDPWLQPWDEPDEEPEVPLSFDIETPASPYRWSGLPPVAAPQKISLPLDPRKGGEILLSAEAVQLAMSGEPEGGEGSQSQKQFLGPTVACKPYYYYQWKGFPVEAKTYYGNSANTISPEAYTAFKKEIDAVFNTESPLLTMLEKK